MTAFAEIKCYQISLSSGLLPTKCIILCTFLCKVLVLQFFLLLHRIFSFSRYTNDKIIRFAIPKFYTLGAIKQYRKKNVKKSAYRQVIDSETSLRYSSFNESNRKKFIFDFMQKDFFMLKMYEVPVPVFSSLK